MKKVILLMLLFSNTIAYSQVDTIRRKFSDTEHIINNYRTLCQNAWERNDSKLANTYYDSIKNCIIGSYIDNHQFKTLNGETYKVGKTNKPIFLTISASWCAPCKAEIPALNDAIERYADKIDFIVLFWDVKAKLNKLAAEYNQKAYLIPSPAHSDIENTTTLSIGTFKSITGYPTTYLINVRNKILDYLTGAAVPGTYKNAKGEDNIITEEDAYKYNYKAIENGVTLLLSNEK